MECEVEFDYEAELSDELSIKTGDIIKDVKRMEGGWWEGNLNGKRGVFPDNFVKVSKSITHKIELITNQRLAQNNGLIKIRFLHIF